MEALLCRTRVPARALHLHSFVCALRSMVSPPSNRLAHFLFSVCSASIRSSCCFRKRTISAASTFLFFVAIASDCFVFFFVSSSFSLKAPRSLPPLQHPTNVNIFNNQNAATLQQSVPMEGGGFVSANIVSAGATVVTKQTPTPG